MRLSDEMRQEERRSGRKDVRRYSTIDDKIKRRVCGFVAIGMAYQDISEIVGLPDTLVSRIATEAGYGDRRNYAPNRIKIIPADIKKAVTFMQKFYVPVHSNAIYGRDGKLIKLGRKWFSWDDFLYLAEAHGYERE